MVSYLSVMIRGVLLVHMEKMGTVYGRNVVFVTDIVLNQNYWCVWAELGRVFSELSLFFFYYYFLKYFTSDIMHLLMVDKVQRGLGSWGIWNSAKIN